MTFTSNSGLSSESEEVKLKKQGWDGLDMCSGGIVDKMDKKQTTEEIPGCNEGEML